MYYPYRKRSRVAVGYRQTELSTYLSWLVSES